MALNTDQNIPSDPVLIRRLQSLIIGRMIVIFVLLMATWWWVNGYLGLSIVTFPFGLFLFFVFAGGLSIVYFLLYRTLNDPLWQLRGQMLIDSILISWLVMQTGEIFSPFITLYIISITLSGYLLGRTDTIVLAAISASLFAVMSFTTSGVLATSATDDQPVSRVVQAIAFNIVGILIVGLLSARLSERRRIVDQLRQSEESFADLHILHERIVESIGTGLITTDLEGRIFAFNRAAEAISARASKEVIGTSLYGFLGDEARGPIESCLDQLTGVTSKPVDFEVSIVRGGNEINGSKINKDVLIACSAVPLLAMNETANGLIVSFQDITKIRELEAIVRRNDNLAAVGRMAAGLAHEIRNPLGSMSSALQFLDERTAPATKESSLMKVVLRESDRLNSIITNFLAYARPSAGGISVREKGRTEAASAIRECLDLLSHSPEIHDEHKFAIDLPDQPIEIEITETELKQVFWNIVRNAIAAMPTGGELSVSLSAAENGMAKIAISDTGVGIAPDLLAHLFEPFSSGSNGAGLGLSIVHKIVTDNGGRIDVESRSNMGTTANIEFPIAARRTVSQFDTLASETVRSVSN